MVEHRPAVHFRETGSPEERRPMIVMELAEGRDLFDYVAKTGRFSPELTRAYFR
jgi:hypothetical protein